MARVSCTPCDAVDSALQMHWKRRGSQRCRPSHPSLPSTCPCSSAYNYNDSQLHKAGGALEITQNRFLQVAVLRLRPAEAGCTGLGRLQIQPTRDRTAGYCAAVRCTRTNDMPRPYLPELRSRRQHLTLLRANVGEPANDMALRPQDLFLQADQLMLRTPHTRMQLVQRMRSSVLL